MLARYGRSVGSVFDLLGRNEVDLTAALGWTLTASPRLLDWLWHRWDLPGRASAVEVSLEVADDSGRTDLQLSNTAATVVIEAKRGWLLPDETQLAQYLPRLTGEPHPLLVSLSDSSHRWAKTRLVEVVGSVPVAYLAWDDVRAALRTLRSAGSPRLPSAERVWLDQLATYLASRDQRVRIEGRVVADQDQPIAVTVTADLGMFEPAEAGHGEAVGRPPCGD